MMIGRINARRQDHAGVHERFIGLDPSIRVGYIVLMATAISQMRTAGGRRRATAHEAFDGRDEVRRLIAAIGAPLTAELLGVSRQQPAAWNAARERIGSENRRKLSDLFYLVDRLSQVVHPARVREWLIAPNVVLGGGRPLDVFRTRGPIPLVEMIERLEQGAYV